MLVLTVSAMHDLFDHHTIKINLHVICRHRQCQMLRTTVLSFDTSFSSWCRFTNQDIFLSNMKVSKGTFIYVSLFALHTSRLLWNDAEIFAPERWISCKGRIPETETVVSRGADDKARLFIPFSSGPRNCIAQVIFRQMARWYVKASVIDCLLPFNIGF